MNETPRDPHQAPLVQKKAIIPPGVLPRNMQTWVILGIAFVMAVIIFFSGRSAPKDRSTRAVPAVQAPIDPSEERIREYRAQVEEQVKRLAEEQSQLARTKEQMGLPAAYNTAGVPQAGYTYAPQTPERSALEAEKQKREYQSLFASNIVLTYRSDQHGAETSAVSATSTQNDRLEAEPGTVDPPKSPDQRPGQTPVATVQTKYPVYEGTVIETVLTNRLDGSFSGPVNCMVTANVYSKDRQHLLVPQGSRMLGEAQKVDAFGQQRLAVSFHRLLLPNGDSVSLDKFKGLNQIGETGLKDQVDHHYLQVFGVSLAIGAIAGFSQINTSAGINATAEDAYRQGAAASLSQSSLRILDRYLNVLPTFTIREGHRVKVYLSNDLLLAAYQEHQTEELEAL
jgi:type IV secretory pathway VirB10-like protein